MRRPAKVHLRWDRAYRIVPSRYPPIGLFDRVADPADLEAVFTIESMTNTRIREDLGALALIPKERRVSGPGTTPIMAAFTHINPDGSRFSDGTYGVFYAAHNVDTALRETVYHRERFLRDAGVGAIDLEMRCYQTRIHAWMDDIRKGWSAAHAPDSYVASRQLASELRAGDSNGIVYRSVRDMGGECIAVFYPDLLAPCTQCSHYVYQWDGNKIAAVLQVNQVL